jgi:hypothetical protein
LGGIAAPLFPARRGALAGTRTRTALTLSPQHTLMFGGSYKSGALAIMRSLSTWAQGIDK